MSAIKDLQDATTNLQVVSALVIQALADASNRVSVADVQAQTAIVLNVTDSLRRALPVPPPA